MANIGNWRKEFTRLVSDFAQVEESFAREKSPVYRIITMGNMSGIKRSKQWPVYSFTYFLLPLYRTPTVVITRPQIRLADFVRFWRKVDDSHKERRLLVDLMCANDAFRCVNEVACLDALPLTVSSAEVAARNDVGRQIIFLYMVDDYIRTIRQAFIDAPDQSMLHDVLSAKTNEDFLESCLMKHFSCPWRRALANAERSGHTTLEAVTTYSIHMLQAIFGSFLDMYEDWKTVSNRKRYLKKLRVAAPHWSAEDRLRLTTTLDGGSTVDAVILDDSYVAYLIEKWGKEKFKLIAFGKEKFCAHCGQSSYTAKDRLWSCKRCVTEKLRHKARYCNTECQRADWLKHRAEMHSVPSCESCGRKEVDGQPKLRACVKCLKEKVWAVRYCNVECQKAHWPEHKEKHSAKARNESVQAAKVAASGGQAQPVHTTVHIRRRQQVPKPDRE